MQPPEHILTYTSTGAVYQHECRRKGTRPRNQQRYIFDTSIWSIHRRVCISCRGSSTTRCSSYASALRYEHVPDAEMARLRDVRLQRGEVAARGRRQRGRPGDERPGQQVELSAWPVQPLAGPE